MTSTIGILSYKYLVCERNENSDKYGDNIWPHSWESISWHRWNNLAIPELTIEGRRRSLLPTQFYRQIITMNTDDTNCYVSTIVCDTSCFHLSVKIPQKLITVSSRCPKCGALTVATHFVSIQSRKLHMAVSCKLSNVEPYHFHPYHSLMLTLFRNGRIKFACFAVSGSAKINLDTLPTA